MTPLLNAISSRRVDLSDEQWCELLLLADRTQCTPLLAHCPALPDMVREAVAQRAFKARSRRERIVQTCSEVVDSLQRAGVPFVAIKGLTHELDAELEPGLRFQNDIDLLLHPADIPRAQTALRDAGFHDHPGSELSDNHVCPLLKPTDWSWSGDYFDPGLPVAIELHHTVWNTSCDRIPVPGVDAFWERRTQIEIEGLPLPVFEDADRLGIAALHLLRHVLRNNARPSHGWELARMLQLRAQDSAYWQRWRRHPAGLRSLEIVAFQFAAAWFGHELPEAVRDEWDRLPPAIHAWFAKHAFAPMENLQSPNKAVLGLHLALLKRWPDKVAVARRRLAPVRLPHRSQATGSYAEHVLLRTRYHAVALARVLGASLRWKAASSIAPHNSD